MNIAALIPHQGAMCLLHRVESHDAERIHCIAISHASTDNPLRRDDRLPAVAAAEYAAQAMALHGALRDGGPQRPGYLAALRDLRLHAERLDELAAPLDIHAETLSREAQGFIYRFTIRSAGRLVAEGQVVVRLP